jgi:aspartyl protease family protein
METMSEPRFIYLIILLVLIVSSFVIGSQNRGPSVWRAARWWVLIFGLAILAAAFWPDVKPRVMAVIDPSGGQARGDSIVFRKQTDGHFYARADVNGTPITFAVDTGASTIALTRADAMRIGLDPAKLAYDQITMTANGTARMSGVRLRTVIIGGRQFDDVAASVIDTDLDVSLMGMSFLSQFGRLIMQGDQLILEKQ